MSKVKSSNLGYPRIGEKREWKKALEQFWAKTLSEEAFLKRVKELRLSYLEKQKNSGIDLIPIGDFSLYDHILDTAVLFGLIPERFHHTNGAVSLDTYFSIARGNSNAVASEMTKWFNTNYHYIVPEINAGTTPYITENRLLNLYLEAKKELNIDGKPVIVGPVTLLKLSKGFEKKDFPNLLRALIPLYIEVFTDLQTAGATWVQVDEPILSTTLDKKELGYFKETYEAFHQAVPNLNLLLQTYFESVDHYQDVAALPVQGIGLDFVYDDGANLASLEKYGFPEDKVLAAGVVDGRNIWRTDLDEALQQVNDLLHFVDQERLWIQPSCSLQHVPVTVRQENELEPVLKNAISFADEKLKEVVALVKGVNEGRDAILEEIKESKEAIQALNRSSHRNIDSVKAEIQSLGNSMPARPLPFSKRQAIQEKKWQLPLLPTTTIGSLPQTKEIRSARQKWRKGEWTESQYAQFIQQNIAKWIKIQEDLDIDVLVHGEFERNDMVEYFGEKLRGFAFTRFAWVQSYGSRCVKPPIIFGDVDLESPMTVKESTYAQSLTTRPVKGMLTGPVTIYNWSFVRNDIRPFDVINQIALALKKEIQALEENEIRMIQVDEPAIREGLPLKEEKKEKYLHDAVYAFRLATSYVENSTQIHTHMCYSEFDEIIDAIDQLDADVISIEAARSHGEIISTFEDHQYDKGIGLGVYDIHSPRIPSVEEIKTSIERALRVIDPKLFWINPDCGLKTRKPEETIPALKNLVQATKEVREKHLQLK
ncbi:5-methyltetrahydropteroyltriglutamate--homocysteine S-methyltransferase [Weizmannia sp. CD-2023]|uniref:5-methyltetrahydropteroyltriglutamate-- homocysteine S-methyltransferase n=1 Tax=Weizmannia sp. CD-2023 TaxID=3037263 RepID=UPI002E1DF196|nr:5-methyltetrahydropteroyltriglutamate--homocysteine S-methyltransferase [Weizmannia sp. CD-2023]MED4919924.1 5-methyltetrahydropteroyltriglutamate--homocysteine S-methyltransferase [Weizmannia sp. CD-2023]